MPTNAARPCHEARFDHPYRFAQSAQGVGYEPALLIGLLSFVPEQPGCADCSDASKGLEAGR